MDSENEVIFILPYINVNTTSTARFKSFIDSFIQSGAAVKVVTFNYPVKRNTSPAHQLDNEDLAPHLASRVITVTPTLNLLKKLAFFTLNTFNSNAWKVFNWIHQAIYGADVFSPGRVDLNELKVDHSKTHLVIACGGPFGLYSYAATLAKKLKAKLVLDYRDPWTFGYVPLGAIPLVYRLSVKRNRGKELRFLKQASLVTTVSPSLKQMFPIEFLVKVKVVENGSNFSKAALREVLPETFNIVYLGTLYDDQLVDETMMKALQLFCVGRDLSQIKIQFLGSSNNKKLAGILAKYGLAALSEITDRLRFESLEAYLNEASVFLQLKYGQRSGIITSKQADYLHFKKPILLAVSDQGDIARSILENKAGFVCETVEENVAVLQHLWTLFLQKETFYREKEHIEPANRGLIAKNFVELVRSC